MIVRDKGTTVVIVSGGVETEDVNSVANVFLGLLTIALSLVIFVGLVNDLEQRQRELYSQRGRSRQSIPTQLDAVPTSYSSVSAATTMQRYPERSPW